MHCWLRPCARDGGRRQRCPPRGSLRLQSELRRSVLFLANWTPIEANGDLLRTLDALHLASCNYLRNQGQSVSLASYDHRMTTAARALAMPVYDLEPS